MILAWALSLGLGGGILNILYFRRNKLSLSNLIPQESRLLVLQCIMGLSLGYFIWLQQLVIKDFLSTMSFQSDMLIQLIADGAVILCLVIIIIAPIWRHPIRENITAWVLKSR